MLIFIANILVLILIALVFGAQAVKKILMIYVTLGSGWIAAMLAPLDYAIAVFFAWVVAVALLHCYFHPPSLDAPNAFSNLKRKV